MLPVTVIAFSPFLASVSDLYKLNFAPANSPFVFLLIFLISNGYVFVFASLGVVVVVSFGLFPYSNEAWLLLVTTASLFTFS